MTHPGWRHAQFAVTAESGVSVTRFLRTAILCLAAGCGLAHCQTGTAGREISGVVTSDSVFLPGVTVFAIDTVTGNMVVTSTDASGRYALRVASEGEYILHAEMMAFAPATKEVVVGASGRSARADFTLVLLSRGQSSAQPQNPKPSSKESKEPVVAQENSAETAGGAEGQPNLPGPQELDASPDSALESIVVSGSHSRRSSSQPGGVDVKRPHGNLSYSVGDSRLDAASYSLTGAATPRPAYVQHRFSASAGGPLAFPGIQKSNDHTTFFISFSGSRLKVPFEAFSRVPTLLERSGNFSETRSLRGPRAGLTVGIFDPQTRQQFVNNTLPVTRIDSVAAQLLKLIPEPNMPGEVENFRFASSTMNNANNLNFRLVRAFGNRGSRPLRKGKSSNLNIAFHYQGGDKALTNPFPSLGGNSSTSSFDVSAGYVQSAGKVTNSLRFDLNRQSVSTRNLYAFKYNIGAALGITGVSQDPFDWGPPDVSFTNFSLVNDTKPRLRHDQTFAVSDFAVWSHGRHSTRWGGDFRRIQLNRQTDSNPRGDFTFTGVNTAQFVGGAPVPGTGFDFADFLLGLPQLTSVQFGGDKRHFRGNSWDLFAQEQWRLLENFTLNLGVRYEDVSPLIEIDNRIVNLDAAPGFTAVAPVLPGARGRFSGTFPATLVNPDRNNLGPRLGLAWKPIGKIIVRAGYSMYYSTGAYPNIAQQLAFQPPFSVSQTNIESDAIPLTLQAGFPPAAPATITNNFGVDRNFRLAYVQTWTLDIQDEVRRNLIVNLDYTGTDGTRLDILEAPNRGPSGVRIAGVQPFLWEESDGKSAAHSGTLRVRKRLERGISIGGSFTFSKSIDNASTIGGGATVVAQDAFNLAAERGLSSFDQRNLLRADYLWELPFGRQRRWLTRPGLIGALLGDWQWSGDWTIASGTPFTARVLGNFAEVNRGTNGTLRADVTGQPLTLSHPTVAEWFNPAAFTVPPLGRFGNARRNTIFGPGTAVFNMAAIKEIRLGESGKVLEARVQVANVFNTPQFTVIDTVVNSPSYGRVTSVGSMRRLQIELRFRF
jgi:trimeric autotransporter adhesin